MTCWLIGIATPLILMLIGAPVDMKMSEAFFSDINWKRRFIADMVRSSPCVATQGEDLTMSAMKRLFQLMSEKKASDIFMSTGAPINIKINGVAIPINQQVMDGNSIQSLLYEVLTEKQKKE